MAHILTISSSEDITLKGLDDKLLPQLLEAKRYIVDLSELKFIRLVNAVNLLLLIGYLELISDERPLLKPPYDEEVTCFLANMHFFVLAESHCLPTRAVNLEPGNVEKALQIRHIPAMLTSEGFHNWLTVTQTNIIIDRLNKIAKGQVASLTSIFVELTQNLYEHSKSYGYIAAQVEPSTKRPQSFHLTIGDLGVGIFKSLTPFYESNQKRFERAFGPLWDEMKALDIAFAPGVSSKAKREITDEERGVGLWSVLRHVKESGGAIVCRTGHSKIFLGFFRGRWRTQRKDCKYYFPGTQLDVKIPLGER